MIERSEVKCRKDSLWQRMLIGGKLEEKDNVSLWMKKKHLDKIGSMCYIYLLCVSLSVTIILKQHNQLWIEEISPVFRGSKGMIMFVYVHQRPFFVMRSINLKSDLSFLKILKYTCFYSVTGLIKLVQLFFTLTASETRIWRVLGTPGNVGADVLGFDRCKTHPIPQHELLVVQWTVQKASG